MDAVCIDLDNVIADTDPVLRRLIRELSPSGADLLRRDVVCYEYWRCKDRKGRRVSKRQFLQIHEQFLKRSAAEVPIVPGAAEGLRYLRKQFEIHVATSRPERSRPITRSWLEKNEIRYDQLHFVGIAGKQSLPGQFAFAVEDDLEQAYALLGKGIPVYLLAYPWNETRPYSRVSRARNWKSLLSSFKRLNLTNLPR